MDASNPKVEWHADILPRATRKALEYLKNQKWLGRSLWYLAGGTALALQVGHRTSLDLDFFIPTGAFTEGALVKKFPDDKWVTNVLREGTIYGKLLDAKVSFIAYPFFIPRQPFVRYGAVKVLDRQDIAVMKIVAISQRGTKRDFVDLYWFCMNQEPLDKILERLPDQYPKIAHNYHHIIKSLAYFADAEADPMPRIFFRADWKEIKKFFQTEAPRLTRKFVGLKDN